MLAVATNNQQVIVGLGVTGLSCARYLSRMQQPFSVVDSRVNPPGLETFRKEFPSVSVSLGDISDAVEDDDNGAFRNSVRARRRRRAGGARRLIELRLLQL